MSLQDITSVNSGRKGRIRVGRGAGSGKGKTCGRGHKGSGSRSGGGGRKHLYEGGQFPFWQRLPKRGFSNFAHTTRYQVIALDKLLAAIADDTINGEAIVAAGLVHKNKNIKIVSGTSIDRKISLKVHKVTASVRSAIEAAGGSVEELNVSEDTDA